MTRRALVAFLAGLWVIGFSGAEAEVRRWEVVRADSAIALRVGTPLGGRFGRFERWTGDIRFDPSAPERAEVSIEVEAASLRMDDARLTATATGAGFLDSARHPQVAFRLRTLRPQGGDRYAAEADITVKGVTRPVTFPVRLRTDGRTAQMMGGFSLDRAAFGIGTRGPWNALIGRQVRVEVMLVSRPAT